MAGKNTQLGALVGSRKQIVIPRQFFIVYPGKFKNSAPWTNNESKTYFPSLILFLSSKKYSAKSKENSESFPTVDVRLAVENSQFFWRDERDTRIYERFWLAS